MRFHSHIGTRRPRQNIEFSTCAAAAAAANAHLAAHCQPLFRAKFWPTKALCAKEICRFSSDTTISVVVVVVVVIIIITVYVCVCASVL